MKKIKTYERLQGGVRIVAGILEKKNKAGKTFYQVFCRYTLVKQKTEYTDFRPIYDRQKAIENSQTMLEQVAFGVAHNQGVL